MIPPVLDGLPPVAAHAPALTAATAETEAEAAQPVAADSGVVLAQNEPLDPVVVAHRCDCLSRALAALASDPPQLQGHAASCPLRLAEHVRQSRLARWQAQR